MCQRKLTKFRNYFKIFLIVYSTCRHSSYQDHSQYNADQYAHSGYNNSSMPPQNNYANNGYGQSYGNNTQQMGYQSTEYDASGGYQDYR